MRVARVAPVLLTLTLLFGCSSNDTEATPPDSTTSAPSTSASAEGDFSAKAAAITDLVIANDWAAVRKDFDDTMLQEVAEERMAAVWMQVVNRVGAYRSRDEPEPGPHEGDSVAFDTTLHFEHGEETSRVAFDTDGKVAGLFLLPASAP